MTTVATFAISLIAFCTFASVELSRADGSYRLSIEIAVRKTSIGKALFGTPRRNSVTSFGSSRSATSEDFNCDSSDWFGSLPFQSR